ncbi:MAG: DUF937 domain-containing protein [Chloroflexi bacterium]|nr:DUF937 domain-containing protein [Chloroflexota bacterium]
MDDLLRGLSGTGGDPASPHPAAAFAGLSGAVQGSGGIDGLLAKMRAGGLGGTVDSWVSPGPNEPVDPAQLGQALGPDTVSRLSAGSGIDIAALLPMLAAFLPQIIDMLTPDGQVPSGGLNQATGGGLPDLGGLLGGLLGGGGAGSGTSATGTGAGPDLGDVLGGLLGGKPDR